MPLSLADVDGNIESRKGTISVFNGPPPRVVLFDDADAEVTAVVFQAGLASADLLQFQLPAIVVTVASRLLRSHAISSLAAPCLCYEAPAKVPNQRSAPSVGADLSDVMHFPGVGNVLYGAFSCTERGKGRIVTAVETLAYFLSGVQEALEPFFDLFRDERVAIGLAMGLLAVAVGFALWFRFGPWRSWYSTITQSARRVETTPKEPTDFFNQYESIRSFLGEQRRLSHAWSEFEETLIVPEAPGPICNAVRPQAFFNPHTATDAGFPLPFYLALPNYFVGAGLLLTFIGLVSALHFSAQGVTSPNVAEAQHALEGLLKAATFKFLTSIAGVFASIALSMYFKALARKLQVAFDWLNSALEVRLRFVTAESLGIQQREELKRQTLQLERFDTDFAVELANALDQRLSTTFATSLSNAVQPVVSAVESLSGNLGSQNQDAIIHMVGEFQRNLSQSTGTELGNVVAALGSVRETLDRASAGMNSNGAAFGARIDQAASALEAGLGQAMQSMTDRLAEVTERMETALREAGDRVRSDAETTSATVAAGLQQAGAALNQGLEHAGGRLSETIRVASTDLSTAIQPIGATLMGVNDALQALDGRFNTHVARFNESIGHLQSLAAQLERTAEQMRSAGTPVAAIASRFEATGKSIEEAGRTFTATERRLSALAAALEQSVVKNNTVWAEYSRRFENADEQLGEVVRGLTQGADDYQRRIGEFVAKMDEKLATAIRQFGGAIDELSEVLGDDGGAPRPPPGAGNGGARPGARPPAAQRLR